MELEDSRFALFPEPNAYIQFDKPHKKENNVKKIVFQEPYETLPQFYLNNDFKKHDCDCVYKTFNKHDFNCKHEKQNSCCNHHDDNCNNNNHNCNQNNKGFGFDLKGLLPLLGAFNKGGGADLTKFSGLLNNNNTSNLISTLLSNKDMMSGILNMIKGGGLNFNKTKPLKKQLKTTDFEIKNYTRVE